MGEATEMITDKLWSIFPTFLPLKFSIGRVQAYLSILA